MKTKESIRKKALELFNEKGVRNVTLREVAKALNRAYGNITYHYPNKEQLVSALYDDLVAELQGVSGKMGTSGHSLLRSMLEAPRQTFQLSFKYIFLFMDFVEIRRSFPALGKRIDESNEVRMQQMRGLLVQLQKEGKLRQDLWEPELDYLMELSGAMRTFFFLQLHPEDLKRKDLEEEYVDYVNRLLIPYLSPEGLSEMTDWLTKAKRHH